MQAGERQQGYALLAMMIAVAVLVASSLTWVTRASDLLRREREQELLKAGDDMAAALAHYYRDSAPSNKRFPPSLEDLLYDRRAFGLVRHLRRIPIDPVMRNTQWGLVRAADGGIMGVYSLSADAPMREVPTVLAHVSLPAAQRYSDWKFVAQVEK